MNNTELCGNNNNNNNNNEKSKNNSKIFVCRESILTELLETDSKTRLLYCALCALLAIWFAYVIGEYITDPSVFDYDVQRWNQAWKRTDLAILTWIILHIPILLAFYPVTQFRLRLLSAKSELIRSKIFNKVFAVLYVSYMIAFIIASNRLVVYYRISTVWNIAIKMETLRLAMKMHSFAIETNHQLFAHNKQIKSRTHIVYPTLSQFLYFLIAPTMIYANTYPKTERIRWRFVLWQLFHFILICLLLHFTVFNRFFPKFISRVGIEPLDCGDMLHIVTIGLAVATTFFIICCAYTHCWYNLFAELTRFGDRHFYSDWWTARSNRGWVRQWHSVVQDWMYYYAYKPSFARTGSKLCSNYAVWTLALVGHEYFASALGFAIMFFIAHLFAIPLFVSASTSTTTTTKSPSNGGQVFRALRTITLLSISNEIMLLILSLEWYSRINCPNDNNGLRDFIIARFPSCVSIKY